MTKLFFSVFTEGISRLSYMQFDPFLKLFSKMMDIEDSQQAARMDTGLLIYLRCIEDQINSKSTVSVMVKYLARMANKKEKLRKKVMDNKTKVNEVLGRAEFRIL